MVFKLKIRKQETDAMNSTNVLEDGEEPKPGMTRQSDEETHCSS